MRNQEPFDKIISVYCEFSKILLSEEERAILRSYNEPGIVKLARKDNIDYQKINCIYAFALSVCVSSLTTMLLVKDMHEKIICTSKLANMYDDFEFSFKPELKTKSLGNISFSNGSSVVILVASSSASCGRSANNIILDDLPGNEKENIALYYPMICDIAVGSLIVV